MAKKDDNAHNSWFDVAQTIEEDSFVSDVNHPSSIDGPIIEDAEVVYEENPNLGNDSVMLLLDTMEQYDMTPEQKKMAEEARDLAQRLEWEALTDYIKANFL